MAIYQYTAPDGNKYRVNAPEGATDQQVYSLVLQNYPYAGQTTKELEEAPRAPSTLGDVGRSVKQGLAGGLQSLTNIFGVDNAASQYLGEAQQSAYEGMSPARKEEMARRQELIERSGGDIKSKVGSFTEAPLQTGLQALASSAPIVAGAFVPGGQLAAGASLGARALAGARGAGGIGGLMGVGGQKGQDYEAVKQALLSQGESPEVAEQKAQEAAAYSAQNAPRQFVAGGAGALEGVFGIESVLANAAKKVAAAKGATSLTPPEFKQKLGAVAGSTLGEALPEAAQAAVGQVGTNIALNQAGVAKDLTDGLAGTVAHDALVGSVLGLAVSPLQISNLQRQYKQALADDQAKKQFEAEQKQQAEAQKAEAERAVLQKQTDEIRQKMEQQQAIALPAPSEEIPVEEVQTDPLKNPLGNIRKSEVPFDIYKQIDDYRKQAGLPKLKEYSIEDFVDAMPGQNPKAEQGLLDQLITAKSGYAGEKYTAQDILNQAKLKNVDTTTKGFKDFLARTTGASALEQMSQPQLHAAFKSLNSLPASEGLNILPEGTNARRFDEKQYDKAIKGVDFLLAELGVPVDPSEVIKTIKEYTNLTEDSHAGAILDTAIKNGDVDLIKTPRYEIYDPKTGTVMPSTYTSRTAARAAAAKRGLNVRQITTDAIAAPSTSATLPEGFDIREGSFKQGEAPAGYDVLAGDEVLFKANTVEEANAKKDSFERTRAGMANARENQITQLNNAIEASQKRLTTMEAQGKGQTTGYQKAAGKHAKLVADTQAKIAALTEEIKKFDPKVTALAVKPTGTKAIGRKGYTVFEQGQSKATYSSRQAAEDSILAEMDDKQLQELTQQQGRRAIGKKAQAELERRTPKAPTAAEAKRFAEQKPVSEVLEGIETEAKAQKAKVEAAKETPEVKEKLAKLEAELKPLLKQFGLGNIKLNFVEKLVEGNGSYNESLIKIALSAKEPVRVLRHESLHALKDLGFFTPEQWSALERMAKDQWIDKYLKSQKSEYKGKPTSRYDAYVDYYKGDMSKVTEEAIADAFADFANNKAPAGMLAALLKRLNDFFTALRNALNSAGFQTAEDIFGKIERGELKAGTATKGGTRFSLFPEGAPLSTRPVMDADDTAARTALGLNTTAKRGRYNNVRDIARALNNDTLKNYGAMDRKQLTDDDVVKIANAMADEVSYQLGTTAETGTGLGWYSNNYPNAVKRLQSRFPELADNKHARSVFSAIVAVTSNGEKVTKNIANAVELYSKLREGKTMVAMGNRRATALENNLRTIERLLEDHKTDFEKHLLQEITVKDMNARLREMGEKSDGSYLADTVVPRAAIYFGPKLGAFYANLSGSEGYLTMDLWWTRSINRMRGLLIPKATEASIEKFRDMMDQPEADRDEVAAAAIPLRNKYKEYGFKTELEFLAGGKEPSTKAAKPAWFKRAEEAAGEAYEQRLFEHNLEKMANTIYKNEYEMLEEAPFTATDRAFMYKAARNAQETLRKNGIDLTLADIQAALWYYEKRLYGKLSGVKADDIGYEEAIIAQAGEGRGRARPSVVFGRGSDGGTDTGRAVQRTEEAGREPPDNARLSLREAPDTPEFKQWFSGSKVVGEDGKPLVVYHGSPDFKGNEFTGKVERKNRAGNVGGYYFTPYADEASDYAADRKTSQYQEGSQVLPVYLNIKRPYIAGESRVTPAMKDAYLKEMIASNQHMSDERAAEWAKNKVPFFTDGRLPSADALNGDGDAMQRILKAGGYDGFKDGRHWVAFESSQIKSAIGNVGTYGSGNPDIRYSLREVDDFFNKADGIKEPEGVEIIRENWIGSVSGLGDRDSAYDLYRVQGGKKYIDDVQNLVRDQLGESFKGYRLMSVEELEEIKAGAMGSQLASFTLRPDIAHAFANLASYRKVPKDQLRVVEMDLTPEHVVMVGHHGERELVVDYGQGYNPDAVVETSVGAYEQYNPTERLSLRDSTDPDTLTRVNETTTAREEKGYVERITKALGGDTFSELRARSLNRYNRLSDVDKEVVKKRGGAALMADESAEAGALQSDLAAGVTASVLGVHDRNGGIPIYVNGVTKAFNDGGKIKGPVAIFAPLSKYNDPLIYQLYQFWAGVKRGSRLNAQGKPDIFTEDDVKRAEALEAKHPEFVQIQKEWTTFNNGLVQYLVDTGVLSEGDKARFTEFSDYIPFYRQMEGEKTIGPNIFQSISGVKKPKKLSEGTDKAPLADFLETIVRNTQSSIQMGMKNVAAQRAIDRALEIEMAERLRPNAPTGLDTVQVLEKGQVVTYQVADHLFIDAVKSLNMPELPFIGLLSGPANFLRNMVTKDPGFMLANMVRDSMAAYVTSGVKMTPVADTVRNFGKAMAGTSPEFEALLNAGIGGGYEFSQNIEMSAKAFEKELNKKYQGKTLFQRILNPMTAPTSLWEALEKGTTASDMATRIEVYKRTLAETNNEAEALHRALEVMNFNRKGSSPVIRILTAAIPFLNARMQGLDVLYRASFGQMNNKDAAMIQKRFIVRGLTMAALSAMYWTLTHDDEEYKKQEQETKDNNWLIPSLGIKIPIPFEIGVIFKVIPERIMALTLGQDTNKDFMDSMARNLRSTLAIDYLPQAIKPFVETETNFSLFTRRPIVGQGLEGVAPEFQVGPGTSSVAAALGSNLGMSPMKIDHLIGGYTGTMGMYMVSALDGIMNMNAENPNASKRFEQLPFIKRFALDPEARGTVTGYYDLKNATDEVVRTSSLLERTMNFEERGKFMQENIKLLANKDYILDLEKTMKEFRQAQVMIRSSRMDADAKREALLRINQVQNALTANINMIRANVM